MSLFNKPVGNEGEPSQATAGNSAGFVAPDPGPAKKRIAQKVLFTIFIVFVCVAVYNKACGGNAAPVSTDPAKTAATNAKKIPALPTAQDLSSVKKLYEQTLQKQEDLQRLLVERANPPATPHPDPNAAFLPGNADGKKPQLVVPPDPQAAQAAAQAEQAHLELEQRTNELKNQREQQARQAEDERRKHYLATQFYAPQNPYSITANTGDRVKERDDSRLEAAGVVGLPVQASQSAGGKTSAQNGQPLDYDPRVATYPLRAGTLIEGVLKNQLDAEKLGPVEVVVSRDVLFPYSSTLAVPEGSVVLGTAQTVGSDSDERVGVSFHRIITPGIYGYGIPLDRELPGLSSEGGSGLKDKVDRHYASIFGATLAVGALGGLAQIGNGGGYDPTSMFRNGMTQSTAMSGTRILDHFLQRKQTLTIRQGMRVTILIIGDLPVPLPPSQQNGPQPLPNGVPPIPRKVDVASSVQQ